MTDNIDAIAKKLVEKLDPEFLKALVESLIANGVSVQKRTKKRPGRPKGSTRYIGDIDRSRCIAADALRYMLHEKGFVSPDTLNDREIVDIVEELSRRGWNEKEHEGVLIELLAPPMTSKESVLSSIRAGRSKLKCRKNSL